MSTKIVKWTAILSLFLAMVVLLGGGYFAVDNIPPCPGRVVGSDGTLFFAKADILKGQDVYQRCGRMNHGSVWGYGSQRGSCILRWKLHIGRSGGREDLKIPYHFPGLQFLFSAMAGYGDLKAKGDLDQFFSQVDRPRGIHLCGNPDWDFLLNLDLDVLSLDVYTNAEIFASYSTAIKKFLDRGGLIVWGIVPTGLEVFAREEIPSLVKRLENVWEILWSKGIDRQQLIARSMLSPATCCLVNPDKERTVESAFAAVNRMADVLKTKYL